MDAIPDEVKVAARLERNRQAQANNNNDAVADPSNAASDVANDAVPGPSNAASNVANDAVAGPSNAASDVANDAVAGPSNAASNVANDAVAGPSNAASNVANDAGDGNDVNDVNDVDDEDMAEAEGEASKTIRKLQQQREAIDKIKASKRFQKRKKKIQDSDGEEELIAEFLRIAGPRPGQMANCEICSVRFTVTPYSRSGPDGGLLCNPCGKEHEKDDGPAKNKEKKTVPGDPVGKRRKTQSNVLDGTYVLGAKTLMSLCIETLAKNIELADDLGALPPRTVDKVARMVSKKRLLDPTTLNLFLQPTAHDVSIYDAAKLSTDDLIRVFQMAPNVKNLKIHNAIQFKDEVMEYLLSRDKIELEGLCLHGASLLSADMWKKYLTAKGKSLQKLQVYYIDKHFDDDCLATLKTAAPSLNRIKVYNNQKVTGDGIRELAHLEKLQHLSIHTHNHVHSDVYVDVLRSIGTDLKTLSLRMTPQLDNTVLDAIHTNCRHLSKMRITHSEVMTDAGFVRLFTDWSNRGLAFIDLEKCRHVDPQKPRENPDGIGLCSEGFKALMAHSGKTLQKLNVHACRHISSEAFEEVFGPEKRYEELRFLEISFCEQVTDFVVGCIFRSCPGLKELNVFGCMRVRDVMVPRGKVLVGVPNALGMVIEGQN